MKNVLVTGGAGFIGTNFVYDLAKKDPTLRVVVLDSLTYAGRKENLNRLPMGFNWIFAHGNICSRDLVEKLLREYSIDTVVHFAAESHVDRGIKNPDGAHVHSAIDTDRKDAFLFSQLGANGERNERSDRQ